MRLACSQSDPARSGGGAGAGIVVALAGITPDRTHRKIIRRTCAFINDSHLVSQMVGGWTRYVVFLDKAIG
jgi:hypothetical protein